MKNGASNITARVCRGILAVLTAVMLMLLFTGMVKPKFIVHAADYCCSTIADSIYEGILGLKIFRGEQTADAFSQFSAAVEASNLLILSVVGCAVIFCLFILNVIDLKNGKKTAVYRAECGSKAQQIAFIDLLFSKNNYPLNDNLFRKKMVVEIASPI